MSSTKIARMVPEIGRVTKPVGSPPKISSERRSARLQEGSEDEGQHQRAGFEAELLHQVADDAEDDHQEDVERRVVDRVDAEQRDQRGDRRQDRGADAQDLHEESDQRHGS